MLVTTGDIKDALLDGGMTRDAAPMFSNAGYRDKNGGWLIMDESSYWQDTDHLIEDCVTGECYDGAAIIKRYADKQSKKQ